MNNDAALRALTVELALALRMLYDEQDGSPLETRAVYWTLAMKQAEQALARAEAAGIVVENLRK